ncbi:MAG: TIGR03905 family TSCPD domain-containing protein [Clostridia bacterium]
MQYIYRTSGTCSSQIHIETDENDVIRRVKYTGGCNGNLQGISAIVEGMKAEEVIKKFKGIRCGMKPTSCPDQLARALEQMNNMKKTEETKA